MKKLLIPIFILISVFCLNDSVQASEIGPKEINIKSTAYYSPVSGQSRYYRNNYEEELMLNGLGEVTASGASIYKGVIAAPSSIPFGTLIEIYNNGFFVVEDRGSAIYQGDDFTRIDIWKGFGENALNESLNWGMRDVTGWVYPDAVKNMNTYIFNNNLEEGSSGYEVEVLQSQLKKMGFYTHAVTGFYGPITKDAVFEYQKFKGILDSYDFPGAGRVGPGTRRRLNFLNMSLDKLRENKKSAHISNPPHQHYSDLMNRLFSETLSYGDVSYEVYTLQQQLKKIGYFDWPRYTYQYKDATRDAVYQYQVSRGIVSSWNDIGAGVFGPTTRDTLRKEIS